jgi:hypothetical protein
MKFAAIVFGLALLCPSLAQAEPYEFVACNFREGKGMADLDKWLVDWKATVDALERKGGYTAVVLTPQYAGEAAIPDFYWMGTWPDAGAMGAGLKEYFEDGAGSDAEKAASRIMDCAGRSLWWGRTVYQAK